MEGLEIIKLSLKKEKPGSQIFEFENNNVPSCILVKKKKDLVFAQKYHTGHDLSKFPKRIVFLDREFSALFKNVKTNEELREEFSEPVMFKVNPFVYHEFKAITDCVLLDLNPWGYFDDAVDEFSQES